MPGSIGDIQNQLPAFIVPGAVILQLQDGEIITRGSGGHGEVHLSTLQRKFAFRIVLQCPAGIAQNRRIEIVAEGSERGGSAS